MKKQLTLLLALFLLFACSDNKRVSPLENISTQETKSIKGETLLYGKAEKEFYDIAVTSSYYAFLNRSGNTVLEVFSRQNLDSPILTESRDSVNRGLLNPKFTKYNYQIKAEDNRLSLWDNERFLQFEYTINKEGSDYSLLRESKQIPEYKSVKLKLSYDYSITKEEIFGVPMENSRHQLFYFFSPDSGFYWVVPNFPSLKLPKDYRYQILNAAHLAVNEEKKTAVAALRYINCVQFYDFRGKLKNQTIFGEKYEYPLFMPGENPVADKLSKTFIDICGDKDFLYCLYDGSQEYDKLSKIVVFKWTGQHIATLQTDRSIRKIVCDTKRKVLIALAANQEGGRDVVRYKIP